MYEALNKFQSFFKLFQGSELKDDEETWREKSNREEWHRELKSF